jgi:hypothetical protein
MYSIIHVIGSILNAFIYGPPKTHKDKHFEKQTHDVIYIE